MHLAMYSGEKVHDCAQCKKTFTVASSLKSHLLTHSGKKDHKCAKSFAHGSSLETHRMLVHATMHNMYFVKYDVTVSFLAQVLDTVTYFVSHVLDSGYSDIFWHIL